MQSDAQEERDAEDRQLMAKAQGDHAAFNKLFDRYRDYLVGCCYGVLKNREDANDVVTQTGMQAWTKRDTYRGEGNVRNWLYRIAINFSLNSRRGNRSMAPIDGSEEDPAPPIDKQIVDREETFWNWLLARLHALGLDATDLNMCRLHYKHDLKHDEVADLLNLNRNTVKARFRRTIKPAVEQILKERNK